MSAPGGSRASSIPSVSCSRPSEGPWALLLSLVKDSPESFRGPPQLRGQSLLQAPDPQTGWQRVTVKATVPRGIETHRPQAVGAQLPRVAETRQLVPGAWSQPRLPAERGLFQSPSSSSSSSSAFLQELPPSPPPSHQLPRHPVLADFRAFGAASSGSRNTQRGNVPHWHRLRLPAVWHPRHAGTRAGRPILLSVRLLLLPPTLAFVMLVTSWLLVDFFSAFTPATIPGNVIVPGTAPVAPGVCVPLPARLTSGVFPHPPGPLTPCSSLVAEPQLLRSPWKSFPPTPRSAAWAPPPGPYPAPRPHSQS